MGFVPVRTADGSTDAAVGVAEGGRVRTGDRVGSVDVGAVLGAEVRSARPLPPGRGVTGLGEAGGVGPVDGPLAGGGASGTTGDTGAPGAVDRNGSATSRPTAHASPAPAAVRSSRRRAAPRRIAS
jgi:hypothetical protein